MNKEDALNMEKNFAGTDKNIISNDPVKQPQQQKKDNVDDMFAELMG